MRNKGFFWFLTTILIVVCLYQLSFTFVAMDVEKDAESVALQRAEEARKSAESTGNIFTLSSGDSIDFSKPEATEIAKAAFLNEVLKEKAETPVYPVMGYKFKDVKERSLAFGLDLVGGMSVTLEISVPELIQSYARNKKDLSFSVPYDRAFYSYTNRGGDFIDLFIREYEKKNGSKKLVRDLNLTEINELTLNSSNAEVEEFLRGKVASSMDGVEQIMGKRINQFGVAQPNIQKESGTNRLYIELPGVQDEATVAKKLVSTANLQFYETYTLADIQQGFMAANMLSKQVEVKMDEAILDVDTTVTEPKDSLKRVADSLKKRKADSINLAKMKSAAAPSKMKSLLEYMTLSEGGGAMIAEVLPENKDEVTNILKRKDIMKEFPDNLKFMWSADVEKGMKNKEKVYVLYAVRIPEDGNAKVGGTDIKNATRGMNQQTGESTVNLTMSMDGTTKWAEMTARNVGKSVAITMDNVVYSAPVVRDAINGGSTEISGDFTVAEANDLAGILNGGALPAPCVIKDQTKVGPTIGSENSKSGLVSFAFAFLAVFIYMYFYYGKGGLVANIALLANVIFIFGCLASFGAVLTLAGIAGIVLTIGTAVDANILIFERVKEEKALGKSTEEAVRIGNIKALPSIIDANMTHLLVAVVLKIFGTGEIESFATTLIVGIFTSVFSAIIISKLIITSQLEKGRDVSFGTKFTHNLFSNFHFDWIGKRKFFYAFSILITIAGIVSLMTRSLNPSVEFTGGRTFGVHLTKEVQDVDLIEEELAKVFVEKGKKEPASVEVKTKSNNFTLEITTNYMLADDGATPIVTEKLKEGLAKMEAKIGTATVTDSRAISAAVSDQMWTSAIYSIALALVVIFAYIFLRFGQWQYSLGAILGLAHDVLVVLSVFSLLHGILPFNMDINQAFIAAVLTVIGYSMNDTVIVFDRIRESLNFDKGQHEAKEVINEALNKTLSRTFNTSMILFVVLLIMFIFGGPAIKGFLFALLIGVIIGTYSSLCVATPILVDFTKRFKTKK